MFDKAQDILIEYPGGISGPCTIPNGVTSIGEYAFEYCKVTSVIISVSVTNIGIGAFNGCTGLTNIVIPNSVTSIGEVAFVGCSSLSSVTIPASVTSIANQAFDSCANLTTVYFQGNAPQVGNNVFVNDHATVVYYLPGTTGWGTTFSGAPTELWNPQATAFTTAGGQFGFSIVGPTNATIVVETCTNLANPVWLPVSTNTLSASGASAFSDPQWTNYPNRYYRFSAP